MKMRWCICQFLSRLACARQSQFPHRLNALITFGHLFYFCGRAVAEPQTPSVVAVYEFVRANPLAEIFFGERFFLDEFIFLVFGKKIVSAVNGLVSDSDFRHGAQRFLSAFHKDVGRVQKIAVDVRRVGESAVLVVDFFIVTFPA